MSYNSNKAYRNSISYSFSSSTSGASEYASTFSQTEYSSKTVISYSGNSNTNYNTSAFSDNVYKSGKGSDGSYIAGNTLGGVMGKGSGRGAGKGKGKGSVRGGRSGGKGIRQEFINIPPQFKEDLMNNSQSDEIDLAINKIQQTDLDIKTQKDPLDIMIEKLEEKKQKKKSKRSNN